MMMQPTANDSPTEPRGVRTRQLYLTVAILLLALWMAYQFLAPLAWAAVLAIAEWPLYRRAVARVPNRRGLIAFGFMLITALFVVVPLSLAAVTLAQESQSALDWLKHAQQFGIEVPVWMPGLPLIGQRAAQYWQQHIGNPHAANALLGTLSAGSILGWTGSVGGIVAQESALFLITLLALVTLLGRGDEIGRQANIVAVRMFGRFGTEFLDRMIAAVRAVVNGTVLVSVVEGATIGVYVLYKPISSKKGLSAHQFHRILAVQYKTAWFLAHRIREAMRSNDPDQFGLGGGMVEVDEKYIGREPGSIITRGGHHELKVLALVDRNTGRSRALMVDSTRPAELAPIIVHNIAREAQLMTDGASHYQAFTLAFDGHHTVNHRRGEYVNADNAMIHTNTIEGYFSIFKRGMRGIYQHCAKKHLHRYLAEFDFPYTHRVANGFDDRQSAVEGLKGITGRRLTYRRLDLAA